MTKGSRGTGRKRQRQRRERRETFATTVPKAVKRAIGRSTTTETPLHIRARGVDIDAATREAMQRHAGFKLGKYALAITRITVRLEDIAGPKGAPTVACKFKVALPASREVVVTATDASPREAFDTALAATERAVRRLVDRDRPRVRRVAGA